MYTPKAMSTTATAAADACECGHSEAHHHAGSMADGACIHGSSSDDCGQTAASECECSTFTKGDGTDDCGDCGHTESHHHAAAAYETGSCTHGSADDACGADSAPACDCNEYKAS